jgi:protein-L-isoaspartate O-methyltransferase
VPPVPTVTHRTTCRACGGGDLLPFLRLDDMPLTDALLRAADAGSEFTAPIELSWCQSCSMVQTQTDVSVDEYYRDYRYTVSSSGFATTFMDALAEATMTRFGLGPGDTVLEIGSGDGAQLAAFGARGARVLGFEPAADLCRASRERGVPVAEVLFDENTVEQIPAELRPARAIVLTYTFDHLPEPRAFLDAVRAALDPERGVLVLEVHDFARTADRRETCLLEHEHTIYPTRASLERLLASGGFALVCDDLLPPGERRGNSLLVAAAPSSSPLAAHRQAGDEDLRRFDDAATYRQLAADIEESRERLRRFSSAAHAAGRSVGGYGAGGRGVMTLAFAGLNARDLVCVADQNEQFHGLVMPKSHVPVVSPAALVEAAPDDIIVFSYGYLAEIREALAGATARGSRIWSLLEVV